MRSNARCRTGPDSSAAAGRSAAQIPRDITVGSIHHAPTGHIGGGPTRIAGQPTLAAGSFAPETAGSQRARASARPYCVLATGRAR